MGFVRFDEHGVLCSLTGVGETGRLDGLSETRFSGASRTFRNIALRSPSGRGLRVYSGIRLGVFLDSVKPRPSLLVEVPRCAAPFLIPPREIVSFVFLSVAFSRAVNSFYSASFWFRTR